MTAEPHPASEPLKSIAVSIHQPAYLPWLGYFDKIRRADRFIYLDTVQFQKQSFQNRNKIRTPEGWIWLTVPVETKGRLYDTPLKDIAINNRTPWRRKHLAAIEMNYRKAPNFDAVLTWLGEFYEQDWDRLSDLCFEMLLAFNRRIGIDTEIIKASDLADIDGAKSELIINLCKAAGATSYIAGTLGRNYLDSSAFEREKIELIFQDYAHPTYRQAYQGFEPYMAVIDLMMNEPEPASLI